MLLLKVKKQTNIISLFVALKNFFFKALKRSPEYLFLKNAFAAMAWL